MEIPLPTRAPGIQEGTPFDQPLLERGDHKKPLAAVPRRFLEVFDKQEFRTNQSGRYELAIKISDPKNPLVSRVIVNRVWHHLFGTGLVSTPDNFGRLGEEPTHPELLDYLAWSFADTEEAKERLIKPQSLKSLIRFIVLSESFRQSSQTNEASRQKDPANRLLTRFPVRRLEAEAIRDSMIAVAAGLDETRGGPSVGSNTRRRSVYVRVQRNSLDPLLAAFDAPEPSTTQGKRDATNVPAQALTLLNDPFVVDMAKVWSQRVQANTGLKDDATRVTQMLFAAAGREPSPDYVSHTLAFIQSSDANEKMKEAQLARIDAETARMRILLSRLFDPARKKMLAERGIRGSEARDIPQPLARWSFDKGLEDSIGKLPAELRGPDNKPLSAEEAKEFLREGSLRLDGRHFVSTGAINKGIGAKTFEAWVQLENLDQRGGAVLSLEAPDGSVFDAIVFGEREPRKWMSGSDFFRRTEVVNGEAETVTDRPVHVAITYAADGKVTLYREGKPYGNAYESKGPPAHAAGRSHVQIGLRHSPPAEGRFLSGKVFEARLYDRALSAEEIAKTAASSEFVSDVEVLAALTAKDRADAETWQKELVSLAAKRQELSPADARASDLRRFQELAQSLFSWKEFLYVY
jgi:hypothetical protein